MSRVESGSSDIAIAQIKDQYAVRERDGENRHKDEIREIRDTQKAELDKVRTEAQKHVEDIQEESNLKLSQKDIQYQKEIESLKAIYAKRASEGKKPT